LGHAARHRIGHVVHLPVCDRHNARQPPARDARQGTLDGGKKLRARIARLRNGDGLQFQVRQALRLRLDLRARLPSKARAIADPHGRRLVDHQQGDVG